MPSPVPSNPFGPKRRKLGPTELRGRRDRLYLATKVLASLTCLPPTPDACTLAAVTGWTIEELMPVLDTMERAELVELRGDPTQPDVIRVMLSATSMANLGLRLSPRGDRWQCRRRWNPDRPPLRAIASLSDSIPAADDAAIESE